MVFEILVLILLSYEGNFFVSDIALKALLAILVNMFLYNRSGQVNFRKMQLNMLLP